MGFHCSHIVLERVMRAVSAIDGGKVTFTMATESKQNTKKKHTNQQYVSQWRRRRSHAPQLSSTRPPYDPTVFDASSNTVC